MSWRCRAYRVLLVDYVEGVLPMQQQRRVERHVAACATCADALRALQEVPALLRTSDLADPGEEFWREQRHAIARAIRHAPVPRASGVEALHEPTAWSRPGWREGWQPRLWRYPAGIAAAVLLGLLIYHSVGREQPPLFDAAEEEFAGLDPDALVTVHDVMQALVPADAGGTEADTAVAVAPVGDYGNSDTDAEMLQASDLSENELEGLDTLVGDFS